MTRQDAETVSEVPLIWNVPRCVLGESLLWDSLVRCFWWVDVPEGRLYRLN